MANCSFYGLVLGFVHIRVTYVHISALFACFWLDSSVMGQTTYIGFFTDWLIESAVISAGLGAITATGSIYFGMFCYINGMVEDVRHRLIPSGATGAHQFLDQTKAWPIYVREFEFHVEIARYTTPNIGFLDISFSHI